MNLDAVPCFHLRCSGLIVVRKFCSSHPQKLISLSGESSKSVMFDNLLRLGSSKNYYANRVSAGLNELIWGFTGAGSAPLHYAACGGSIPCCQVTILLTFCLRSLNVYPH